MQANVFRLIIGLALLLSLQPLWAGPKIESWQTASGATVLFVAAPELPMLDLRVVFDAGSARDGARPGISALTNSLLTDGAGEWNADRIAERLEGVGAEIDTGSLRDMGWVSLRTLTAQPALDTALDTLAAILGSPRFGVEDLERNRKAMQVALHREEQSPGKVAIKLFLRHLYGDHPYGSHSGGTQESLAAITRDEVLEQFRRYYVARNAVVAVVGALTREEAEQIAGRVMAGVAPGEHAPALPPVAALAAAEQVEQAFPSSQSHLFIGQPGVRRGDPDYFPLYVGNHILGGNGLVSQLNDEVREKRGLSYSVYSYFSPMRDKGPFVMGAQTQNARAGEALQVMRETLERFVREGPSEAELTAGKQNITGGFPLRIASNRNIVEYLGMIGFYGLPLDYLDTFVGSVNAVTADMIRDAFQRRLQPECMVTVVVGNGGQAGNAE